MRGALPALALALLAGGTMGSAAVKAAGFVIPEPAHVVADAGVFRLDGRTAIQAQPGPAADSLEAGLRALTGFTLPISTTATVPASSGTIALEMLPALGTEAALADPPGIAFGADRADETYALAITPGLVQVRAHSAAGLFYGVQSLLQIAAAQAAGPEQAVLLPAMHLEDQPRFAWRGLMLDESRHFFGKKTVEELLDVMASLKLNRFHWHLTDQPGWRIEIKAYPKLTTIGGIGNFSDPSAPAEFYTQADIREIVAYAARRQIMVIPEIDMPGHASAASRAYPEISGGGAGDGPALPSIRAGRRPIASWRTSCARWPRSSRRPISISGAMRSPLAARPGRRIR